MGNATTGHPPRMSDDQRDDAVETAREMREHERRVAEHEGHERSPETEQEAGEIFSPPGGDATGDDTASPPGQFNVQP